VSARARLQAWLGRTSDLGIISAAFFRGSRPRVDIAPEPSLPQSMLEGGIGNDSKANAAREAPSGAMKSRAKDELAATGIGREVEHRVMLVDFDEEDTPASTLSVRYEYHEALVRRFSESRRPHQATSGCRRHSQNPGALRRKEVSMTRHRRQTMQMIEDGGDGRGAVKWRPLPGRRKITPLDQRAPRAPQAIDRSIAVAHAAKRRRARPPQRAAQALGRAGQRFLQPGREGARI
jgi:hypothetical protein